MAFHVPEASRVTDHPVLGSTADAGNNGAFILTSPEPGWMLALICSDSSEDVTQPQWEHVSVHAYRAQRGELLHGRRGFGQTLRTPTWKEMAFVKDRCWDGDDVVIQLHPRKVDYVNDH